jgi:hypothetical protein
MQKSKQSLKQKSMQKKRFCANIYRRRFAFQIACTFRVCRYKWASCRSRGAAGKKKGLFVIFKRIRYMYIRRAGTLEGRRESLVILFAMTSARLAKYECTYMKGGTAILRRRAININVHDYKSLSPPLRS